MRRLRSLLTVLATLALAPVAAWGNPGDGILGTPHDFSASGGGVGLCTFCHTPHRAISTSLLWNHTLSTATFAWDDPKTTSGTDYPSIVGDSYKGPTAKCLSCHDGTVAIGDVAWWNEGKPASLNNGMHAWPDAFNVGTRDGVSGSMKGNHPVAMPYPYQGAQNTYNGSTTGLELTFGEFQATPVAPVKLYNDDNGNITAGPVALKSGIECTSCHDPHNKASVDDLFLRGTLAGNTTDYICLKCHIK